MVQASLPFVPKEPDYKLYDTVNDINYTPENALTEGVAMVRDISSSLKSIELGSKLRKEVWMKEIET